MNLKRLFARLWPNSAASSADDGRRHRARHSQRRKIVPQAPPPDLSGVDGIWEPRVNPAPGVADTEAGDGKPMAISTELPASSAIKLD